MPAAAVLHDPILRSFAYLSGSGYYVFHVYANGLKPPVNAWMNVGLHESLQKIKMN